MRYYRINLMPLDNPEYCFLRDKPKELADQRHKLTTGEPFGNEYPDDVRFYMDDSEPGIEIPDFVGNTCSTIVCSARLKEAMEKSSSGKIEYLPVSIYNHRRRLAASDYFIVNPVGVVDCLDTKQSDIEYYKGQVVGVDEFVMDSTKLNDCAGIFRVQEDPTCYVFSEQVVRAMILMKPRPTNVFFFDLKQS